MGGKNKQAQRTKNNARPSSSGRSAEMLASTIPQFAGFHTSKDTFALPGFAFTGIEDIDSSVDSNFQLVLKKMNKKDSTTKLKALQEFSELIKTSEPEAVKSVLIIWTRIYNSLATDAEHRVREAVHVAHYEVVIKAKRNLAPFLKQLAGPWFTSQCDTYAPAASAASKAFQAAFPSNKIQDAIIFCQEGILNYIFDNLITHSAQTLSNSKTTSAEEANSKYERVIISSLQGYTLYLSKLNIEAIEKFAELNKKLVSNNKFWKLAKHKVAPIRSAWFGVLTALCEKAPFLLDKEEMHVSSSVFGNLDESEPTVLPLVWEAALLTITTIKEWWKYINIEKMFLPKFWKVLREGGQGNASIIYPNLLPLMSHLSPNLDINNFYGNYFENIQIGLKQKSVLASRSESNSIATSIVECFQYVILKNEADIALCEKLIKTQIMPLLEWCFMESHSPHKVIFNQIAAMVQYWSRNNNNQEVPNYSKYVNIFWHNIYSLFQGLLMNLEHNYEVNAITDFANKYMEFLICLKHNVKPKKQHKVTFSVDGNSDVGDANTGIILTNDLNEFYLSSLHNLVYKTCEEYIKFINNKENTELIQHLTSIIQEFENPHFFLYLNEKLGAGDQSTSLIDVYNNLLVKWMKSERLSSKSVIDLLFVLFKYLNVEEKQLILEELSTYQKNNLHWSISQALSHPHNQDPQIQKWLGTDVAVGKFLVGIAEQELKDECTTETSLLLKQAFTENIGGVLFIGKDAVCGVIKTFNKCLLHPEEYLTTIDTCASLAAYISVMIYTENLNLSYGEDLLLALFTLNCNSKVDSEYLSKDTLWEVSTAWQDAISSILPNMNKSVIRELTSKFANIIEDQVLNNKAKDIKLQNLVNMIVNFVRCCQKSNPLLLSDLLLLFFNRDFVLEWKQKLINICKNAEYLRGSLSSPYKELNIGDSSIEEEGVIKYFIWMYLIVNVVAIPLEEVSEDSDDESEPSKIISIFRIVDNFETLLLDITYNMCLSDSLIKNYKNCEFYQKLLSKSNFLKQKIKTLFNTLEEKSIVKLTMLLQEKLDLEQWFWARVVQIIYSDFLEQDLNVVYNNLNKKLGNELSKLHIMQTFSNNLTYDDVEHDSDVVESVITLKALTHCDEIEVQIVEVFCKIEKLKNEDLKQWFYDINFVNWKNAQLVIEVINLCSKLVECKSENLSKRYWDFILISLSSWTEKMVQVKHNFKNKQVAAYLSSVANLFYNMERYINQLKTDSPKSNYIDEWNDLFAENIQTDIINTWFYLTEQYQDCMRPLSLIHHPFLQEFGTCLQNINYVYIFNQANPNMPKWSKILKRCCSLLLNSNLSLQLWGYNMLLALIPGLIEVDLFSVKANKPHEKGLILEHFKLILNQTNEIVQTMLSEFKLGEDSCTVQPYTDSYTYTFAYLLIWDIILTLCEKSPTELCYQYADWLRKGDFLNNLLNNVFKLMPSEVLHYCDGKIKLLQNYFLNKFKLSLKDECTSSKLEEIVCWVYTSTVSQLPASVRQWWSGSDTRTVQIVEKVTSAFVSPQLCLQELSDVAKHENKFKNMVIKVHPVFREVVAIYTVDEAQMELVITLPTNYPLGGPNVQCNRQISGTSHKQWLMQFKKCVLHQNGRIWDGLSLWNNNLDKKFDGVEECYICFAVLHPGTYQLPKLCCQTCRKKFHSACLYKWFSTSNKSTCPICRNLF